MERGAWKEEFLVWLVVVFRENALFWRQEHSPGALAAQGTVLKHEGLQDLLDSSSHKTSKVVAARIAAGGNGGRGRTRYPFARGVDNPEQLEAPRRGPDSLWFASKFGLRPAGECEVCSCAANFEAP